MFFIVIGWCGVPAQAQTLQPVPALTGHVIDTTGTLDAAQRAALDAKLTDLERDKGAQVVVLMVPTTAPEDIAAYANRVGNSWKIGRAGVGDGLIVLVAKNDRRTRIEVAKTLEGAVPDIAASHIIDQAMTPFFRQGDFAGGLNAAVDQLAARVRGEPLPPVAAPAGASSSLPIDDSFMVWIGLVFFALPMVGSVARALLGTGVGSLTTGALLGGLVFLVTQSLWLALLGVALGLVFSLFVRSGGGSRLGRGGGPVFLPGSGGGWGGGGGGGGFSSGGGGDFGGGGASGSW